MKTASIRILHVLGSLKVGGAESFVMNLFRAVDRERIQFDFIKHTTAPGDFEDEIASLGGKIYVCPRYNGKNHFAYCQWWREFFKKHSEYKIIHGHIRSTASIYLPIAKKFGLTTIIHSHSTSNGKGVISVIKNFMQFPIKYEADYLFACSEAAGRWMYGERALKQKNYKVIPNAIDLRRFVFQPQKRKELRERMKLTECLVIGHVGRFSEDKNHKFLVDIFSEIFKNNKNARLLLVGDGELKKKIQSYCSSLSIGNAVLMTGTQINTEDYYQVMDVFAFPSLWAGFPMSVVEAQAVGLPCYVSDMVTREVGLSDLVTYLPIDKGPKLWADYILKQPNIRLDVQETISALGFDVHETAKKLMEFYSTLEKR